MSAANARKPAACLSEVIDALRAVLKKISHEAETGKELDDLLKIADTLARAGSQLSVMLKTEREFDPNQDTRAAYQQALQMLMEELGIEAD